MYLTCNVASIITLAHWGCEAECYFREVQLRWLHILYAVGQGTCISDLPIFHP